AGATWAAGRRWRTFSTRTQRATRSGAWCTAWMPGATSSSARTRPRWWPWWAWRTGSWCGPATARWWPARTGPRTSSGWWRPWGSRAAASRRAGERGGRQRMQDTLACFKAYDVRGIVPDELNEELAYRIGRAYAAVISPRRVCVGRDVRPSGEGLVRALTEGLTDAGVDVVDIGLVGTEQVYFATFHYGLDGGIMVTASHNPPEYNGMKFVRQQARPISGDSGLREMEELTRRGAFPPSAAKGRRTEMDVMDDYVEHLLTYVDVARLKPFRIACNPGNGCAGPVLERLGARLPFELVMRYAEPDGSFPHGVPNPLLPENRAATAELVRESGADFGVAGDGDFD